VVLGLRATDDRASFLEGKADAVLGELPTTAGPALAYDAVIDPELCMHLLDRVVPGTDVGRARLLGADQSNTSVVFDERLIMKLFRRLYDGPNPDAAVTRALADAGFTHVPPPVGEWCEGEAHMAVVSEFLAGGVDGFHLALTSLRDLYDARVPPWEAGGDFGPDARRLGAITAELHLAMVDIFGTSTADVEGWNRSMLEQLDRVRPDADTDAIRGAYDALRHVDVGPAIRVHGDYHLGQVLRTDTGWYVLDFEGEPARPLEERLLPSSPLRDVAGMLRSFQYAAEIALRNYGYLDDDEAKAFAVDWEARNAASFLRGYRETPGIERVLPDDDEAARVVLTAFLLDKAVYEVGYEASHRPDWGTIPLTAIHRILEEPESS
jgi:maltokinase